jgi:hypothetical protein
MAGDWIKMECCTPEKSEVLALTVKMGWEDTDLTVGKLFRLWRWFDQQTEEGNARGVTAALLDRIVGVSGFCQSLSEVGWLTITDDGISLPNFDLHNGHTAKSRSQTAKRVAKHKGNAKGNAVTVTSALAREEKRREEDKETPADKSASSSKSSSTGLRAYLEACKASGTSPIPKDHALFRYCDGAGIDIDMTRLAWMRFREEHLSGTRKSKRYSDWPAAFSNCIKDSWYGLWYVNSDGPATWSSKGIAARKVADVELSEQHPEEAP